jgi:sec-independent protein translocase protein TatA
MISPLAFIGGLGYGEMLVVGFIALLLFGKKLPEVARSLGKGVTEFKKGIQGLEDEIREGGNQSTYGELPHSNETQSPQVPKFEPPVSSPEESSPTSSAQSPDSGPPESDPPTSKATDSGPPSSESDPKPL